MQGRPGQKRYLDRKAFGHALIDAGLSLADLARLLEISYERLAKLSAALRPPRKAEIDSIAKALGIAPQTLLRGPNDATG